MIKMDVKEVSHRADPVIVTFLIYDKLVHGKMRRGAPLRMTELSCMITALNSLFCTRVWTGVGGHANSYYISSLTGRLL